MNTKSQPGASLSSVPLKRCSDLCGVPGLQWSGSSGRVVKRPQGQRQARLTDTCRGEGWPVWSDPIDEPLLFKNVEEVAGCDRQVSEYTCVVYLAAKENNTILGKASVMESRVNIQQLHQHLNITQAQL